MSELRAVYKSFSYAAKGIAKVAKEERNFRFQLAIAGLVAFLMLILRVPALEMAVLSLAIALVLVLELLNSILERVVDILKPRIHHYVEDIKDMMAGAVLVASVAAALIGFLIFWPYLETLI